LFRPSHFSPFLIVCSLFPLLASSLSLLLNSFLGLCFRCLQNRENISLQNKLLKFSTFFLFNLTPHKQHVFHKPYFKIIPIETVITISISIH
jgi:hypothetical protein